MFAHDVKTAFTIAWLIIAILIFPVLLAPLVLPQHTIFALIPECPVKAQGRECVLCGMTTSFVLISSGRFDDAVRSNKASIPLYAAFVWNECAAVWYSLGELGDMWRRARRTNNPMRTEEFSCRS